VVDSFIKDGDPIILEIVVQKFRSRVIVVVFKFFGDIFKRQNDFFRVQEEGRRVAMY
jgi:hypothetical protein